MFSLYEYSLCNIFSQLINCEIKCESLEVLPEDILNDLDKYLMHINKSYEYFIDKCFYKSLKLKHFVFAKFFLTEITKEEDVINIVNNGLFYIADIETAIFLINNGANEWDNGLLRGICNNDMNMIQYFIELGANDFNSAMFQAIIKNNILLIKYYIDLGADDFDGGLFMSTQMNNIELINYYIKQGATDFNGGLYTASRVGLDNLILFYINLGADDYITALGGAIDNNNFNKLLIPPIRINVIHPCLAGNALLYFLKNTNFKSRSGININHLIPYLLNGYATEQTLRLLMKLYIYNNKSNKSKNKHNSYYVAFGRMPSLNEKILRNNVMVSRINYNKSTTFNNIKKYHIGFCPNFVDSIYFSDIVELNICKSTQLPKDKQKILITEALKEELWRELMIVKAIVDFYD